MGVTPIRNIVLIATMVIALTTAVVDSYSLTPNIQDPFSKWRVRIINRMTKGYELLVHCKSKDDDLGPQTLVTNQAFSWHFKENLFVTTKFWCYFSGKHGHAEFDVFWQENHSRFLADHCDWKICIWIAKDDGIYLRNIPAKTDDYKINWNTA